MVSLVTDGHENWQWIWLGLGLSTFTGKHERTFSAQRSAVRPAALARTIGYLYLDLVSNLVVGSKYTLTNTHSVRVVSTILILINVTVLWKDYAADRTKLGLHNVDMDGYHNTIIYDLREITMTWRGKKHFINIYQYLTKSCLKTGWLSIALGSYGAVHLVTATFV